MAQDAVTDLKEPEAVDPDMIGDVPVVNLTPDDEEEIRNSGDWEQLMEDSKHPNLHQHPIRILFSTMHGIAQSVTHWKA